MIRVLGYSLSLCLLALSQAAWPVNLQDLVERGELQLRSWVEPHQDIVVGQEVRLTIEVATQRWFAGGTAIRHPDEKNLVILRRDSFANNLSRREGDITWVIQRWNLELYPQAPGEYQLPAISLELAVNDAEAGVVRGTMETGTLSFEARLPPELEHVSHWVASPTLDLEQTIDREPRALLPGDAFSREITLRATQVTAMMLPPLEIAELPGLAAYAETPRLRDSSNRGEATAESRVSVTYVVEQAGQYELPEQVFYWWDTSNGELKTVILPTLSVDAGMAPVAGRADESTSAPTALDSGLPGYSLLLSLCVAGLLIAAVLWRQHRLKVSEAGLRRQIGRALRKDDHATAVRLLYQWLNLFQPQPDWYQLRNALARAAGPDAAGQADTLLAACFGSQQGNQNGTLPRQIHFASGRQLSKFGRILQLIGPKPVVLQLNPGNNAAEQKASY